LGDEGRYILISRVKRSLLYDESFLMEESLARGDKKAVVARKHNKNFILVGRDARACHFVAHSEAWEGREHLSFLGAEAEFNYNECFEGVKKKRHFPITLVKMPGEMLAHLEKVEPSSWPQLAGKEGGAETGPVPAQAARECTGPGPTRVPGRHGSRSGPRPWRDQTSPENHRDTAPVITRSGRRVRKPDRF
jgi:hypothetical protein